MAKREVKGLLATESAAKWERLGATRRAGILAPLFSVYSKSSLGMGGFSDLKLLVDLCGKTGASILQLLPMNEVGATFCPYDAISAFALEPAYISPEGLFAPSRKSLKDELEDIGKNYPVGAPHVDYAIKPAKEHLLWEIYRSDGSRQSKEVGKFSEKNAYWLDDFALFKALKNYHGGKPWHEWSQPYRDRHVLPLKEFSAKREKEISFHKWVQWIAFEQFVEAKNYASSKKVLMKGDLPILISRDSADVWANRELFKLDFAAGAPPDMYCAKGQRWGVPTYDWDRIAADDYRYLKEKLDFAENFYDILRIDHVVGLFRIWSIPYNDPQENEGLNGFFDPRDEGEWRGHGRRLLSITNDATSMLLCGEDLGMIPRECPEALREFGIPGNDVQRWAKDWSVKHDFLEPGEYRLLSAAMLSTHDTTNWAAWWENEAGTIDEALFIRKCKARGIDHAAVRPRLFDPARSGHGRLRWLKKVSSTAELAAILGKPEGEIKDFIDIYEDTYMEKEKLWKKMGLAGPMKEGADPELIASALGITLESRSVFCIELITDYLMMAGLLGGDPYDYRINRPGTVNKNNWSLRMPVSLEELMKHKVCDVIRKMVTEAGR